MRNGILSDIHGGGFRPEFKTAAVAPLPPAPSFRPRLPQIIVNLAVKADDIDEEARTFEGLLSVWGLDLGDDVMHKGAFKKTLKEWKASKDALPLLNSHNHFDIFSAVGQLIDAKETDEGLWTKWEVDPGQDGDRVLARIRPSARTGRSTVSKMSIGYEPMTFDFEQSDAARFGRIRNLREVSLKEGSLVLFPMAPGARLDSSSVKSFLDDANAVEGKDLTKEAKDDLRRLASRIGKLLDPKAKSDPAPKPEPVIPAPGAKGGDDPTDEVDPPAPPTPTPAPGDVTDEGKGANEGVYPYGEALQQRLLGLKVSASKNSSHRIDS